LVWFVDAAEKQGTLDAALFGRSLDTYCDLLAPHTRKGLKNDLESLWKDLLHRGLHPPEAVILQLHKTNQAMFNTLFPDWVISEADVLKSDKIDLLEKFVALHDGDSFYWHLVTNIIHGGHMSHLRWILKRQREQPQTPGGEHSVVYDNSLESCAQTALSMSTWPVSQWHTSATDPERFRDGMHALLDEGIVVSVKREHVRHLMTHYPDLAKRLLKGDNLTPEVLVAMDQPELLTDAHFSTWQPLLSLALRRRKYAITAALLAGKTAEQFQAANKTWGFVGSTATDRRGRGMLVDAELVGPTLDLADVVTADDPVLIGECQGASQNERLQKLSFAIAIDSSAVIEELCAGLDQPVRNGQAHVIVPPICQALDQKRHTIIDKLIEFLEYRLPNTHCPWEFFFEEKTVYVHSACRMGSLHEYARDVGLDNAFRWVKKRQKYDAAAAEESRRLAETLASTLPPHRGGGGRSSSQSVEQMRETTQSLQTANNEAWSRYHGTWYQ